MRVIYITVLNFLLPYWRICSTCPNELRFTQTGSTVILLIVKGQHMCMYVCVLFGKIQAERFAVRKSGIDLIPYHSTGQFYRGSLLRIYCVLFHLFASSNTFLFFCMQATSGMMTVKFLCFVLLWKRLSHSPECSWACIVSKISVII